MADETTEPLNEKDNSSIFGVSLRGWITLMLCSSVCFSHIITIIATLFYALKTGDFTEVPLLVKIDEPLYSMAVGALGFYLGQKFSKK